MKILVSGLLNTETDVSVQGFPINYYPIDYSFFGVNTAPSGVGYNISKALSTLGDEVRLISMTGDDFSAGYIRNALNEIGVSDKYVRSDLKQTPSSVVLYDSSGKRQIYCDLKDIQETDYPFTLNLLEGIDLVAACNISFNRSLLRLAKEAGKIIATDVHVLSDINDGYNREFMEYADILFLSDEAVGKSCRNFIFRLADTYNSKIIVMGCGSKGAAMYQRKTGRILEMPAVQVENVVNTVGAGDALFSAFLHYYAKGYAPEQALKRAQIFAAKKITVCGASNGFSTEEEVEKLQNNY